MAQLLALGRCDYLTEDQHVDARISRSREEMQLIWYLLKGAREHP